MDLVLNGFSLAENSRDLCTFLGFVIFFKSLVLIDLPQRHTEATLSQKCEPKIKFSCCRMCEMCCDTLCSSGCTCAT